MIEAKKKGREENIKAYKVRVGGTRRHPPNVSDQLTGEHTLYLVVPLRESLRLLFDTNEANTLMATNRMANAKVPLSSRGSVSVAQ